MAKTTFNLNPAKIKVIGVGGGGCNAVTRMVRDGVQGVEFIAMNSDAAGLALTEAPTRIQLGEKLTRGLGVGGDHLLGQKAAEENREEIKQIVSGADMVFVTCGMGGGTGTGGISVVAEQAKQSGALTIAVVTKPFAFEGTHRMQVAEQGIAAVLPKVDTLIMIPNDRLLDICDQKTGVENAFKMADDVLRHAIQSITDVITVPGIINLDFADVKAIMKDAGPAWMSIGSASGKDRAVQAAKNALTSPLLDVSIQGAKGVLFNVTGGNSLTLLEVNQAAQVIKQAVDADANIIFGVAHSPTTEDFDESAVSITLIATGFAHKSFSGESKARGDEMNKMLKNMKVEEELDVPAFLRYPLFSQRRQVAPPATPQTKAPAKGARVTTSDDMSDAIPPRRKSPYLSE